uniref:class I adenylate-forming enzyme family protein n=1 Tax=uncultured Microbacterium sp. TaxID=191216 RepID=UPI0025DA6240
LVEDSRRVFAVVDAAHRAQAAPPAPAPETAGIPITAVSIASAFHAARIVAGLAGYRAVSATIDPQWPLAHRVHVVTAAGIGLVISDDAAFAPALGDAGWSGTVLPLAEFLDREQAAIPADPPTARDGDEAFLLLFSSGTTSDPKAFLKTRRQYRENVAVSSAHLEPRPGVETLAPGPLSYSLTLYALIECLATGGGAHLADAFDAPRLAHRVATEGITRIVAVPAVVQVLIDAARRDPHAFAGLDLVVTGGANLPAALRDGLAAALPHVRLISYYGAAEIGFIGDSRGGDGTLLDVYEEVAAEIRDDSGQPVPDGELGTLWIRAAACSDGYLAATTDAVLRGPDGWATVHDMGRMTQGRLQLAGRAGDIVATGGHKVSLPEVERAFDGMPGLGAVCAIALPDPRLGAVVALVVEGASTPSKADLQAWARDRLAPQFVPRRWYRLDRIPRTAGGKIRRPETTALIERGEGIRL